MMRGTASVVVRAGRLEAALGRRARRRHRFDFSAFDDQELEALAALAAKAEAADEQPVWSPAELAVLRRLEPKLATVTGSER